MVAVKADDAKVPVWLWNTAILTGLVQFPNLNRNFTEEQYDIIMRGLDALRGWLLKVWKKRVKTSFYCWFEARLFPKDTAIYILEQGKLAINYACMSSWWEWQKGSRLFFWKWDPQFLDDALYGTQTSFLKEPPNTFTKQGK